MITLHNAEVVLEVRIHLAENICDLRLLQINGRSRLLRGKSREKHRKRLLKRRLLKSFFVKTTFRKHN